MERSVREITEPDRMLAQWIDTYSDEILRVCFLYLSDRSLAEDALQDTWVKVWKALSGQKDPPEHEKAWLMRIAVNTCRDYTRTAWFRHVDRRAALDELPEAVLSCEQPDRSLSMTVMGLPRKYKQVILLYYYQGLTLDETGEALGLSRSCVYRRLKKAEALLREEWSGGSYERPGK
ncbi:MAG: sigma-70 family RNA polymerase sigma factor [Clostridia bacterium]|nr:sigma-70 family RNA polymerase sigma factor [Clostridia bacterium]